MRAWALRAGDVSLGDAVLPTYANRVLVAAILGVAAASSVAVQSMGYFGEFAICGQKLLRLCPERVTSRRSWRWPIAGWGPVGFVSGDRHCAARRWHWRATCTGTFSGRVVGPQRMAILGRLVWQHWRQSTGWWSRWLIIALLAAFPSGWLVIRYEVGNNVLSALVSAAVSGGDDAFRCSGSAGFWPTSGETVSASWRIAACRRNTSG